MNRNRENRICWNRGWHFYEEYTPALQEKETVGFPEGTEVELPHALCRKRTGKENGSF